MLKRNKKHENRGGRISVVDARLHLMHDQMEQWDSLKRSTCRRCGHQTVQLRDERRGSTVVQLIGLPGVPLNAFRHSISPIGPSLRRQRANAKQNQKLLLSKLNKAAKSSAAGLDVGHCNLIVLAECEEEAKSNDELIQRGRVRKPSCKP